MNKLLSTCCVSLALFFAAGCSSTSSGTGNPGGGLDGINGPSDGGGGSVPPSNAGAAINGGVGKVCASSADCAGGLNCHVDTIDWISHDQCTTSCQSDADCTGAFGSHTMCIGAHICVSKCLDDKDCPAHTTCSENGWCEHNGPGSGVPKCSGIPTACSLLTETECATTLGCSSSGSCSGFAESCSSQLSSFTCQSLSGCYWDSTTNFCAGSTLACSDYSSQSSCGLHSGCSWSASCSGEQLAKTCESQSPSLCKYAPGCSLVPQ
jgi:hypothetical protein